MEFISVLKYGAIGIALALAILSYRLLSQEQQREKVRAPMLKSIRFYLIFSMILSILFGAVEFLNSTLNGESRPTGEEKYKTALEDIWSMKYSQYKEDSTIAQKIQRIKTNINANPVSRTTTVTTDTANVCLSIKNELNACEKSLKENNLGFYSNITKLKRAVSKDTDNFINLEWNQSEKAEVYKILEEIFISLDEFSSPNNSDEQIIDKWKALKKDWTDRTPKYITHNDVSEIVRIYLDKFYPRE